MTPTQIDCNHWMQSQISVKIQLNVLNVIETCNIINSFQTTCLKKNYVVRKQLTLLFALSITTQ